MHVLNDRHLEPGVGARRAEARGDVHRRDDRVGICLLYTSDAADERSRVDLGGRRIIKKKKMTHCWVVDRPRHDVRGIETDRCTCGKLQREITDNSQM